MGAAGVIEQQKNWIMAELGDTILGGAKASMEQKMSADQQAWTNFPQVLPNLGITDCTAFAIRQQFHTILSLLNKHFAQNRFVLGDRISLADFSLYAPFYVHLSRNPVPGFILKTEAPLVAEWIERVSGLGRAGSAHGAVVTPIIGKSGDIQWVDEYPAAEDSSLPDSIIPFLELMMGDFIPQLAETCRQVYDFLDRRKGRQAKGCPEGWQELPRSVGWQEFFLRSGKEGLEAKGKKVASPHAVWMLQELVEEVYVGKENAGNEILKKIVGPIMVMGAWRRCVDYVTRESWVLERVDNRLVARPREAKKEARL